VGIKGGSVTGGNKFAINEKAVLILNVCFCHRKIPSFRRMGIGKRLWPAAKALPCGKAAASPGLCLSAGLKEEII
jgi:hypothetical protein